MGIQISLVSNDDRVLSYQQFELKEGEVSLDINAVPTINIDEITFNNLIFSQKTPMNHSSPSTNAEQLPLVAIEKLNLKMLTLIRQHLSLAAINIENLNSSVTLDKQKNLTNLVLPSQQPPQPLSEKSIDESDVGQKNNEASPLFYTFSLDKFLIGDKSQIMFTDTSVKPKFTQMIKLNKFEVGAIDNRIKDQQTPFDIVFKTDAYASGELKGFVLPFSEKLNLSIDVKIKEFSLPAVSPYISNAMGFDMQSGQFDTQTNIAVTNDLISGETHLAIRGLELSSESANQSNSLKEQSAMPLNSALDMLKDDKGNLELEIPLSGDVSSPQFGVSNFVTIVSKKAIMSTAKSYLMKTLFPYADVLSVVMDKLNPHDYCYVNPELNLRKNQYPVLNSKYKKYLIIP